MYLIVTESPISVDIVKLSLSQLVGKERSNSDTLLSQDQAVAVLAMSASKGRCLTFERSAGLVDGNGGPDSASA